MDAIIPFITLLRPQAALSMMMRGDRRWSGRFPVSRQLSFTLVLEGPCWLAVEGVSATILGTGDFILFPATPEVTLASDPEVTPRSMDPVPSEHHVDEAVHREAATEPSVSVLGGYFACDPINSSMLVDLLPRMLHIRATDQAIDSVAPIVELIRREMHERRAGHVLVLTRLIEVMLIEALRSAPVDQHTTGLLAGLRDAQLAAALHLIHTQAAYPWTLDLLARQAGMSPSSFAERFARVIGMTPLNYLLQWRIALAKWMLASGQTSVAQTALKVGYQSESAFSTDFSRETGRSPEEFIGVHRGDK
jgi:AraC-like DNA-binding protein